MLTPTPLPPAAAFATVADIRDQADLPRMPVTPAIRRADGTDEPLWTRPDGSALTIQVRALSFEERRLVNQAAGESNDDLTLWTCFYGICDPRFDTIEQCREILGRRHPAAVDAIAATIWSLCDLPAGMVEREVRRLAGLPAQPRAPRPRRAPVARGLAAAAGQPHGAADQRAGAAAAAAAGE